MGWVQRVQPMVIFQGIEKFLPLATKSLSHIIPQSFNPGVVNAPVIGSVSVGIMQRSHLPPPDIRASVLSHLLLHKACHPHIFHPMIASHPAGAPMDLDDLKEEVQHGVCFVVVMGPETNNETCLAINKAMYDDLPPDQT